MSLPSFHEGQHGIVFYIVYFYREGAVLHQLAVKGQYSKSKFKQTGQWFITVSAGLALKHLNPVCRVQGKIHIPLFSLFPNGPNALLGVEGEKYCSLNVFVIIVLVHKHIAKESL